MILSTSKPTVIDLFCGAGGLSKGFEMAGFEVLLGVDNNPWCMKTFAQNHPSSAGNSEPVDIEKLDSETIKKKMGNRKIDVIVGGPPCQGFSVAGLRDPNDPRNSLFKHFARLVYELKPKWFVMENVSGLLIARTAKGEAVDTIIRRVFKNAGYRVKQFKLNSADYGVPQKRIRIFYIGTNTKKPIKAPDPTHAKNPINTLLGPKIKKWVPVKEILLPESEVGRSYFHSQKMIEGFRRRKERNVNNGKGFGWQILNMDKPSYTISARYWKDGSEATVKYSEERIRMLTEKECARIQSFPDDYEFLGSKRTVYTQIGNAVPPRLAKAIAIEIKRKLEEEKNKEEVSEKSVRSGTLQKGSDVQIQA
jgi:DNA (cytosine-5)-methyltransferase 1